MRYNYFLTIDSNIEAFPKDASEDVIQEAVRKAFDESHEYCDVALYRVPFDVLVRDIDDLYKYGENVTSQFIPEYNDCDMPMLF